MSNCIHEPALNYQAIFRLKRKPYYVCKNCGEALAASNWGVVEVLKSIATGLGLLFLYSTYRFQLVAAVLDRISGVAILGFIGGCLVSVIIAYIGTLIVTILFFQAHLVYVRMYYKGTNNL